MLGVLPNFPFVSPAAEWNARSQQAERFRFQGPRLLASRAHTTSPRGGGGGPERPCVSTGFLLLCAPAPVELRRQKGDELAERFLKLGLGKSGVTSPATNALVHHQHQFLDSR